jgi:serine protease Do
LGIFDRAAFTKGHRRKMRRYVPVTLMAVGLSLFVPTSRSWATDVIGLKDGHQVTGDVVAEKPSALYVDLGFDILRIPREFIVNRGKPGKVGASESIATRVAESDPSGFYSSGPLKSASVKDLVQKYGEAVISIETPSGKGSGFLINDEGYAITNDHVIQGETRISVILYMNVAGGLARRRIDDVEIVAMNPFFDLALLKLPLPKDLKPSHVVLGNLEDVNVGDGVFAVGNPLGLERSVSQGIVSNRNRNIEGQVYLQTDAAINPGNSGGPLFNLRGEVIGITSLGFRKDIAESLGFAIPISYVKDFIRNREAFSFDKANPNTGYRYIDPPRRKRGERPPGAGKAPSSADKAAASQVDRPKAP